MASISYTESSLTPTSVKVTISGLSSSFNKTNFQEVGVTDESVTNNSTSLDGEILGYKSAPSSGSSTSVTFTVDDLEPDTSYTLYGYTQAKSGVYYKVSGSISFTTPPDTITLTDRHYLDGTYEEKKTFTVDWGTSYSPATSSSHVRSYTGYELSYVDTPDGEIDAGDDTKITLTEDTTVYYYYVSTKVTVTEKHYKDGVIVSADTDDFPVTKNHQIQPGLWNQINSYTNYKFLYVKSSDGKTFYNGDTTWYTFTTDVTFSFYYTNKVSVTTKHMYANTVIWTDNNSPYSATIGYDFTPFHSDYFYDSDEYICSYAMVGSTQYTSSSEKIAITTATDDFTVIYYYTKRISDEELVDGCTARWYNYAAGNRGSWSKTTPTIIISMGDYDFSSTYFIEAGILWNGSFTVPSKNAPYETYVSGTITPSSSGSSTISLTDTKHTLSAGATATYMAYLKTINGTYMPIPAVYPSKDNGVQFTIATKPNDVSYTSGYEPTQGEEVKLKADDIKKFIRVMDYTQLWFTDDEDSGIDESEVEVGELIRASTFGSGDGFYDKLVEFQRYKTFTRTFEDVSSGSPIVAANLIFLKNSINNMLGKL